MKARFLVALPFLIACSSTATPPGDTGTGGTTSTSSGTTSSSTGGGGPQASSCGPDLGSLSPALWGRRYDTTINGLFPQRLTVNDDGESVLIGYANDKVDLGTGVEQSGAVLAAYDPTGVPLAAASIDATSPWGALFRGADLYVASADLDSLDILFEKRDAALASTWVKHIGVATKTAASYMPPYLGPLVATPDGNMIFAGVAGELSLQIGATTMTFAQPDAFVVALDPDGDVLWAVQLGLVFDAPSNGIAHVSSTAVDASGSIAVAGVVEISVPPMATLHPFLAKLDATGAVLWSRVTPSLAGAGSAVIGGLAIAPDGSVIVDGGMGGTVDIGGGPMTEPDKSRFVARYDPAGALAQIVLTEEGCAAPNIVGWTKSGDLAVQGIGVNGALYRGALDPISLAPSYTHGYAISAAFPPTAAIAPNGSLVVSGYMNGPSDFGQGPESPTNPNNLPPFLAALPAD